MMEFGPGGLGVPPPLPSCSPQTAAAPPIPSCWGAAGRTTWGPRRLGKRGGQSPPIFLDPETCGHCPTTRGGGGGPNMASGGMSVHPPPTLGCPPPQGGALAPTAGSIPPPRAHPRRPRKGVSGGPPRRGFRGGPKREFQGGSSK